jgi:hypothetical protein
VVGGVVRVRLPWTQQPGQVLLHTDTARMTTMSSPYAVDTGLLILRVGLGVVFLAHGHNHVFGGGKIVGTGRWFESLGMKPG